MGRTSEFADEIVRRRYIPGIDYFRLDKGEREKLFTKVKDNYIRRGEFSKAIESYEKHAEKLIPEEISEMGNQSIKAGHYLDAVKLHEIARERGGEGLTPEEINKIGDKCYNAGRIPEACEIYKITLERGGEGLTPEEINKIGHKYFETSEFSKATELYERTGNKEGLIRVADARLEKGEYSKAIKNYRIAGRRDLANFVKELYLRGFKGRLLKKFLP